MKVQRISAEFRSQASAFGLGSALGALALRAIQRVIDIKVLRALCMSVVAPTFMELPVGMCADFLDDALMWYDYGAKTSPSFQLRATAEFLRAIFEQDPRSELRRALLAKGLGTEVIVTLRKK